MITAAKKIKPLILAILDGWGLCKPSKGNAIFIGKTPNFDKFWQKYPHAKLQASGKYVGLPRNQVGNSEAGHLNFGAGRTVRQDSMIINQAIKKGRFFKNPAFLAAVQHVKKNRSSMHVIGLLSGYQSAHAERQHLFVLLELLAANNISPVYMHFFTDGRDAPQHAAVKFVQEVREGFKNGERIVSIIGRFFAMDRNKHWERTAKAYDLLTLGKGHQTESIEDAITQAYNRKETDEFIEPTIIAKKIKDKIIIKSNDAIIYFNLRSDRARQLTKAFIQPNFNKMNAGSFIRKRVLKNIKFVAMTDFGPDLGDILTAYPSEDIKETLPMMLKDLRQLYISESEKFAHVTYFFNGGYAKPVNGESRIMVPSPHVRSYAQKPAMSIKQVTDIVVASLRKNTYDFICVNFANPDMIGHTGDLVAAVTAVEAVDQVLGRLHRELKQKNGTFIIVADHGNIEEMVNLKTGEINTEHSANPVPFIIVSNKKFRVKSGSLANVAPTILDIFNLPTSKLMTNSLISHRNV